MPPSLSNCGWLHWCRFCASSSLPQPTLLFTILFLTVHYCSSARTLLPFSFQKPLHVNLLFQLGLFFFTSFFFCSCHTLRCFSLCSCHPPRASNQQSHRQSSLRQRSTAVHYWAFQSLTAAVGDHSAAVELHEVSVLICDHAQLRLPHA